jgi:hypothetical protein
MEGLFKARKNMSRIDGKEVEDVKEVKEVKEKLA